MIRLISHRLYHTSRTSMAATGSSLGKLRKSTGYPVSNCRKALELFPEDITKAEEWLHAEAKKKGWSKWAKIQARSATQGLIGVFSKNNLSVMVEVNCETDFVAKNAEFQQFVEKILCGCINHISTCTLADDVAKTVLSEAQINEIKLDSTTLGELTASAISKFNEKTVTRRAVGLKVRDDFNLCSLSHPISTCPNLPGATLGKYGALLAYKHSDVQSNSVTDADKLGLNICQHIIGMNPLSLGQVTEKDLSALLRKSHSQENSSENEQELNLSCEDADKNSNNVSEEEREVHDTLDANVKDTNETQLLLQPYLLDSNITVYEALLNSGIEVLDFERFECGENCEENPEVLESSSAGI